MSSNAHLHSAALGLLLGFFATNAVYDHHWFPYLMSDPSTLRSRVVASVRTDATRYYANLLQAPTWFFIVFGGATGILLLSLLGASLRDTSNRVAHFLTFALLGVGGGVLGWKTVPAILELGGRKLSPSVEAQQLHDVAFGNLACLIAAALGLLIQIGLGAVQEESETPAKTTKSKAKRS
ncbi:hypothetical protein HK102_005358 [Quaeritorhiza haematococci]|nr:hypothetical protein HK102_005358 [Quaeritorhiza haematococci]